MSSPLQCVYLPCLPVIRLNLFIFANVAMAMAGDYLKVVSRQCVPPCISCDRQRAGEEVYCQDYDINNATKQCASALTECSSTVMAHSRHLGILSRIIEYGSDLNIYRISYAVRVTILGWKLTH